MRSTLKNKIILIIIVLSLTVTLVGIYGLLTSNRIFQITTEIVQNRFPIFSHLRDIDLDIHQVYIAQKKLFYHNLDSTEYKSALFEYNKNINQIEERSQKVNEIIDLTKRRKHEKANHLSELFMEWIKLSNEVVELSQSKNLETRLQGEKILYSDLTVSFNEMEIVLDQIADELKDEMFLMEKNEVSQAKIRILKLEIIAFSLLILVIIFSIIVFKPVFKSLAQLLISFNDIAEGEGNLTKKLKVKGNDEISQLSLLFNTFVDKIKSILIKITHIGDKSTEVKDFLVKSSDYTSASLKEIVKNIELINFEMTMLDEIVNRGNKEASQNSNFLNDLQDEMNLQTNEINNLTELNHNNSRNLKDITDEIENDNAILNDLTISSDSGLEHLKMTNLQIENITNLIEDVQKILKFINKISAQTNFLALNASIESAHAGEAGKGFAVVAEAIRKLAESSAKNSKEINLIVKNIVVRMDEIIQSSNKLDEAFLLIRKNITRVKHGLSLQNDKAQDLKRSKIELSNSVSNIQINNNKVMEFSTYVNQSQKIVLNLFNDLTNRSLKVDTESKNVSFTVDDILKESELLKKYSLEISGLIESLSLILKKFKMN